MLELYPEKTSHLLPISEEELSDHEVVEECWELKKELGDQLTILGHHYQSDEIIQFSDIRGDSLALAQKASQLESPYVIFCGVHFMAETADMVTTDKQTVILPDLRAGCSMADMAQGTQVEKAWELLSQWSPHKIIPVTYINCTAELKAFVGQRDGAICTSSNAKKIIEWALAQGQQLLFFPDQHLGRNTCFDLGIPLEQMVLYHPDQFQGGLSQEKAREAKVILWYGHCSVHQGFTQQQIKDLRQNDPQREVLVHPECSFEVVQHSDRAGSTSEIINWVQQAPAGKKFAIGTEINLVNRLNQENPEKDIVSLSPYQCLCTTMYRVRPRWLLASLRAIKRKRPINIISVDSLTRQGSLTALERMFQNS